MNAIRVPLIGITTAFDDGTDADSLRPGVALHFLDTAYGREIERAGGIPLILPVTASEGVVRRYVNVLDGIIFSGGGGFLRRQHVARHVLPDLRTLAPKRFHFESMLMQMALAEDMPVLGVCRGHQMLVRVMGGSCYSRIDGRIVGALKHNVERQPVGRHVVHDIAVKQGTRLHDVLGVDTIGVNSLHRQAAQRVPPPLVVSARAPDGVIEAVESMEHRFVVGVQFHPELLAAAVPPWRRLFEAFIMESSITSERRKYYSLMENKIDYIDQSGYS